MPVLKNARCETVTQGMSKDMAAEDTYAEAGYKGDVKAATRLVANGNIRNRMDEIKSRDA